ncbi:MAG: hypothetical protein RIT27_540 [Pseudomonadota bacterium]|jgi:hypothetical protein
MWKYSVIALSLICNAVLAETFVVLGTGQDTYYVYDEFKRNYKVSTVTNKEVQLSVGNYLVCLRDFCQSFTIQAGQKTTFQAGTITVSGIGLDSFYVYDEFARAYLGNTYTNKEMEFLPAKYVVKLNNVPQEVVVESGKKTIVQAGLLSVAGIGLDEFQVYDNFDKNLSKSNYTNKWVELLPADYSIYLNGTKQKATIKAGEKTVLKAGTIMVLGVGLDYFYVNDALTEKRLSSGRYTGKDAEVFPDTYSIVLNIGKMPATVKVGERTLLQSGVLKLPNGSGSFSVVDAEDKVIGYGSPNGQYEEFLGTYHIKGNGLDLMMTVTPSVATLPTPITPSTPLIPNTATSTVLPTYNDGVSAGIAKCKADPVSCGISITTNNDGSTVEGIAQCKANPASCGITVNLNNDGSTADGIAQCKANPSAYGISTTGTTTQTTTVQASYNPSNGELYIPKLGVADLFGTTHFYEVYLTQKNQTLDFAVDLSRLKPLVP